MNFTEFNLDSKLLFGLERAGYSICTPVQQQVLTFSQNGSDLYVQSQTGTGKTAAYLVAVINELLLKEQNKNSKVLIMVPTRELAVQVEEEAKILIEKTSLRTYSFFGGVDYKKQISAIEKGIDIIIGTPGRLIDLNENKKLNLSNVKFLIIDEADRMFDMGFYPDLRKLLKVLPETSQRQTMLFSATLNSYVKNLAWEYTDNAEEITIESENITVSEIKQELFHVSSEDKIKLLVGILKSEKPLSVIVFCNTKRSCEIISKRLNINGFKSSYIIGDLPQLKRLKILKDFKESKINILTATDVAARGIDVDSLSMVINYDIPNEAENYVHRIGRTARAGKSGKAYTFCSEQDVYNLPVIERYIEMKIPSKVADSSMTAEDKSAGIYIKIENKNEEYSSKQTKYTYSGQLEKSHIKANKNGYIGNQDRVRKNKKINNKNSFKTELSEIENMTFEERMKFYKQKYSQFNTVEKKNKASKNYSNKIKSNYVKQDKYSKNSRNDRSLNVPENRKKILKNKKTIKKRFIEKLKAFLGIGNSDEKPHKMKHSKK